MLGQRGTAEKSNEKTAIPELLSTLALEGATVTIDAMETQANIAEAIRARGADYVLAVKDNQPKLAESIKDFWSSFIAHPAAETAHGFFESVEKGHGRVETRRCYVFDQLNCLSKPEQWPGLKSFAVIESERAAGDKTTHEQRLYISSLAPDAARMAATVRAHWSVENRLHWCMDIAFNDDQMRARTRHAAHNLASLKQLTLNLIAHGSGETKRRNQSQTNHRRHKRQLPHPSTRTGVIRKAPSCSFYFRHLFMRSPWGETPSIGSLRSLRQGCESRAQYHSRVVRLLLTSLP